MLYCYVDESGTPGIASNEADFLVVSIVMMTESERDHAAEKLSQLFDKLKAKEIHYTHNSERTRLKVISQISKLDFNFISIAIKKNKSRSHASYMRMSNLLVEELLKTTGDLRIEMDMNPKLFEALKKKLKQNFKHTRIKQVHSKNNYCIQLTDYIVALSAAKVKNPRKATSYSMIAKKCISFQTYQNP